MSLPELPKLRKHKEADITPAIFKWFEGNYPKTVALEIKIKGGKIYPHQLSALKKVNEGCFAHKIADTGRRQPFDGFILKNADAFLVICEKNNCVAYSPEMEKKFTFSF